MNDHLSLNDFKVVLEQTIDWGDMDSFKHINNIHYLRYFENARIYYFNSIRMMANYEETGIGPILAKADCKFIFPLTYPDTIKVGVKVIEMTDERFVMQYLIHSTSHNRVAAVGTGEIVMFNYLESKKALLPDELKKEIKRIEG
ncbi:MAG: acyl-CoA thioesterase [Calditrichaeota bacterium]|nr:acyl-CoA thioesterase [Calditrichota bacterium]